MENFKYKVYEDFSDIIDREVEKYRHKWKLKKGDISYDDISQEIKIHIFQKFSLWKQDERREEVTEEIFFLRWVNTVISNFIKNKLRDNYGRYVRPCIRFPSCKRNDGGNLCSWTPSGIQCNECPLFAKWEQAMKGKMHAHSPSSLDGMTFSQTAPTEMPDHQKFLEQIKDKVKAKVDSKTYKIFQLVYLKGLSDDSAAKKLGYKTGDKSRSAGYKTLSIHKKKIYEIIKLLLSEEEYQFV